MYTFARRKKGIDLIRDPRFNCIKKLFILFEIYQFKKHTLNPLIFKINSALFHIMEKNKRNCYQKLKICINYTSKFQIVIFFPQTDNFSPLINV